MQFEFRALTPKALANFSPRVGACDNLGVTTSIVLLNPARVRLLANAFSVLLSFLNWIPGLSLRSNSWAEISERLRRSIQIQTALLPFSLTLLIFLAAAQPALAQALDISSGGQPTITGAVSGSVTGSANVMSDLLVTINFGEVSPLNTNSIVKVVVPVAIRSNQPYQIAVTMSGLTNVNAEAVQASDVGFGIQNMRVLGGAGKICTQSTHTIRSPFNNDPASSVTIGSNGRVSYPSSLADLSASTVILSGPQLSKNNSANRQQSDGYVFDAIFTLTPQFFAAGVSSATLIFSISPGPNVPC